MNWLFGPKQFVNKYLGGYISDRSYIYYDDILEFDPLTGQWQGMDRMIQARGVHAVSVVNFDSRLCV